MRATSRMTVDRKTPVTVTLEMTVEELEGILEAVKAVQLWPMFKLKECLGQSLSALRAAYSSDHITE